MLSVSSRWRRFGILARKGIIKSFYVDYTSAGGDAAFSISRVITRPNLSHCRKDYAAAFEQANWILVDEIMLKSEKILERFWQSSWQIWSDFMVICRRKDSIMISSFYFIDRWPTQKCPTNARIIVHLTNCLFSRDLFKPQSALMLFWRLFSIHSACAMLRRMKKRRNVEY